MGKKPNLEANDDTWRALFNRDGAKYKSIYLSTGTSKMYEYNYKYEYIFPVMYLSTSMIEYFGKYSSTSTSTFYNFSLK